MYDTNLQKLYLGVMLSDGDLLTKVKSITKPSLFSRELQKVVSEILDYVDEYDGIPDPTYIETKTGTEIKVPNKIDDSIREWFIDEFPKFCLHKALEEAVIKSTELIESEDYDGVEQLIKKAQETRLVKDYGLDYSENPKERLQTIKDRSGNISTGFQSLDDTVGKLNVGDLVIYAGGPGSGKSLFLQNNSLHHYSVEGKNVMYITLELSEELCAQRIDSMLLEQPTKRLYQNLDATHQVIQKKTQTFESEHGGMLKIKFMPSGSTTNDIKSFIKDFMVTTGHKVDVLVVDYLDLVKPAQKVQLGDVFEKDKAVSEELRNMGQEMDIVTITASQLNRNSVGQDDLDHSHIAGGISKINTADLVLGIIITDAMREKGYYELQALKVRNSNGTGRRVRLGYKESCMKIHDDEDHLINNNSNGNSGLSETEMLFNEVQNELNKEDEHYDPIDIETGKVKPSGELIENDDNAINVPKEMRPGLGNEKTERLRSMLQDDDEDT